MHPLAAALVFLGCVLSPAASAYQTGPDAVAPVVPAVPAADPAPSYTISSNNADGEVFVFTIRQGQPSGGFQVKAMTMPLEADVLRDGLSQADLDGREGYVERLVTRLGVRDEPARKAAEWLQTQARTADPLAWTARLVLRELEQRYPVDYGARDTLALLLNNNATMHLSVDALPEWRNAESKAALQWSLENDEQRKAPGQSVQIEALVRRDTFTRFPVADLSAYGDYTFELRCGPDQARLRVLEVPEIKTQASANQTQEYTSQVREYHGRSLEEILSGHPELESILPFAVQGANRAPAMPRTDVLGVYVRSADPDKRIATTTQTGELVMAGMLVARVEPGTIAESMGVAPGSVMIKVCGQPVMNGDSISESLRAARERLEAGQGDGAIEVEWLDPWRRHRTRIWRGTFAR